MKWCGPVVLVAFIGLMLSLAGATAAAAQTTKCNFATASSVAVSGGGTNGVSIAMAVTPSGGSQVMLGTFTRPTLGGSTAAVSVSPAGTRSLPSNLTIASDTFDPSRAPRAATVDITGGGGCRFRVTVAPTRGDLRDVRISAAGPYQLSTDHSGAIGRLDALGRFRFTIGVTQDVTSAPGQTIGGTVSAQVEYY